MRLNYLFVALLLIAGIFVGCNDHSDDSKDSNTIPVSEVSFVDKGAVVPNPVSLTVTITPDSIEYVKSQTNTVIEEWSNPIEASDFDSVQRIIDVYDLFNGSDITLAEGQIPCTGWQGMTVTLVGADTTHTINIPGSVCSRDQWSEGVRALVELKDDLVEKYHE
ncbi:MAG: hypothetical protein WBN66_07415 [Smithella sp.]